MKYRSREIIRLLSFFTLGFTGGGIPDCIAFGFSIVPIILIQASVIAAIILFNVMYNYITPGRKYYRLREKINSFLGLCIGLTSYITYIGIRDWQTIFDPLMSFWFTLSLIVLTILFNFIVSNASKWIKESPEQKLFDTKKGK